MLKIIAAVCSMFFVSTISTGHAQSLSDKEFAILLGTAVIAGVVLSQQRHRHQPHHYGHQPRHYGHQPQYYGHQNHRRHYGHQPRHNRGYRH